MKEPIIPIRRASESLILLLVRTGILTITEDGLKVSDR